MFFYSEHTRDQKISQEPTNDILFTIRPEVKQEEVPQIQNILALGKKEKMSVLSAL